MKYEVVYDPEYYTDHSRTPVSATKISEALKEAYDRAIHCDTCEYRVSLDKDGNIRVDEYPANDSGYCPDWLTLKKYCMWPSVLDWLGPDDTGSEEDLEWMYNRFVYTMLDDDVYEATKLIERIEM